MKQNPWTLTNAAPKANEQFEDAKNKRDIRISNNSEAKTVKDIDLKLRIYSFDTKGILFKKV